jgi:hypothetical protein
MFFFNFEISPQDTKNVLKWFIYKSKFNIMYFFFVEKIFFHCGILASESGSRRKNFRIGSDPNPQKIKSDPQLCLE